MQSTRGTCDRADKSYVTQVHQGTGGTPVGALIYGIIEMNNRNFFHNFELKTKPKLVKIENSV